MITTEQRDTLIRRAVEHREADRLLQNFGYFQPMDTSQAEHFNEPGNNGEKTDWQRGDWAGCAIGCLATEVLTQAEYRKRVESGEFGMLIRETAVDTLERDFGVPASLATVAEDVFESLPKDDAVKWPEQFARALPVGTDELTDERVLEYERSQARLEYMEYRHSDKSKVAPYALALRDDLLSWMESIGAEAAQAA